MKRVLLVDDNQELRSLLTTLLGMEGYEVVAPELIGLAELVHSARNSNPQVMLCDVHLPGMNGLDIIRLFRNTPELSNLHILMTSGEDFTESCITAGADGFLQKPYMPAELISMLQAMTHEKE